MKARLDAYLVDKDINFNEDHFASAVQKISSVVGDRSLRPYSIADGIKSLPKSTGSGYPHCCKKGDVLKNTDTQAKILMKNILKDKAKVFPCYAAARRVVRRKGSNKPRLVWVYPSAVSALESKFSSALQTVIPDMLFHGANVNWLSSFEWYRTINAPLSHYFNYLISLDYAGFDSSIPAFVIRAAFQILRNQFELTYKEEKVFKYLENYFIHTPLNLYGDIHQKHRGIPSGSCFTSIIGTLCNMIVCQYALEFSGSSFDFEYSRWLGDDSRMYVQYNYGCSCEGLLNEFIETGNHFGMSIHPDKSFVKLNTSYGDEDCDDQSTLGGKFLSRSITWRYPQLRFDKLKAKIQLFLPEHKDKSPTDAMNRLIGLTWAYGFHRDMYNFYHHHYIYLKEIYRAKPLLTERDKIYYSRLLQADIGLLTWTFPKYEELHLRYFGYC
jgi:hypothetical protein